MLTQASTNLATRPPEEHYESFKALSDVSVESRKTSIECSSSPKEIYFVNRNDKLHVVFNDKAAKPTHWALTQLATATSVPISLLERLKADTAAKLLNEVYPREDLTVRAALINGDNLRSITSEKYNRLWDAQILDEVDRWLLPEGKFIPAIPTINTDEFGTNKKGNTKPSLFRSDRDMFTFFYSKDKPQDDGLGGLRKGIIISNSEVGAKAFAYGIFYFREMCSNFLIWDATVVKQKKLVHKANVISLFKEFKSDLMEISNEISPLVYSTLETAKATNFVSDGTASKDNMDKAVERLIEQFNFSIKNANAVVVTSQLPENTPGKLSNWSIVNGITGYARTIPYASQRTAISSAANRILASV
jgi:hypothetical protein